VGAILEFGGLAIPAQERDDLEQEVMTEVWQAVNRSQFDLSGGFWGFVEVVTSRRCIDWLRTRREKLSLPDELVSSEDGPLRSALQHERSAVASAILSALGRSCRELVILRLREDLSYREIAETTGKSEGALRVQFHRCIGRARDIWARIAEDRDNTA
jgi:RNA polymerase sigma-70 factor (ECF subfamily)